MAYVKAFLLVLLAGFGLVNALFSSMECNDGLNDSSWVTFSSMFPSVEEGDNIEIPCGTAVNLDVKDLPRLDGLRINGWFRVPYANGQYRIAADSILVQGIFWAGHRSTHFRQGSGLDIVLTNSDRELRLTRDGKSLNFGNKAFAVVGGRVLFNGMPGGSACQSKSWTKLVETAEVGSNTIVLDEDVSRCWWVGHTIAIASTSLDHREREHAKITAVSTRRGPGGKTQTVLTVEEGMRYEHTGMDKSFTAGGQLITEAAEVGLLSRSLTISGETPVDSRPWEGGHFVIHETGLSNKVHGTEIFQMGQQGVLGKYPAHFHMCEDVRTSSFVANSVHDTMQRGTVIHGSQYLQVEHNVYSNLVGHGILLEDHSEYGNIIKHNVGFFNKRPDRLIKINGVDETDLLPSMFWLTNPDNVVEDNASSGSQFSGFWYELADSIRGLSLERFTDMKDVRPRTMKLGTFRNNEAHSNRSHGFRTYPDGYEPSEVAEFVNLKAWKNRHGIFLHNSRNITVQNAILADNYELGLDFNEVLGCTLKDSIVIGKSELGEVCPTLGAVRNSGMTYTDGTSGNRVENVRLDKFGSCREPVISQMIDDRDFYGYLPASTALVNVESMDREHIVELDAGFKSSDYKWMYAAIEVVGGNTMNGASGYLVTNKEIMLSSRGEPACSRVSEETRFCPDSCYRTVRIAFPVQPNHRYSIRITRTSDRVTETVPYQLENQAFADFFLTLRAGHEYAIELLLPSGMEHPRMIGFNYSDGPAACKGKVTLLFRNRGFAWSGYNENLPLYPKPCPGSDIYVPADGAMAYDRCYDDNLHRAIEMPEHILSRRNLYVAVDRNSPAPRNDVCSKPVTRCTAFGEYSEWMYHDSGSEPSTFTTQTVDATSWKQAKGTFGYGYDDLDTYLEGKHRTYYFRKQFDLTGDVFCYQTDNAAFNTVYGDGFIVYINGEEVYRKNMPDGPVDSTTYATTSGIRYKHEENLTDTALTMLRRGANVISVEVHRYEKDAWDTQTLAFDMQLDLALKDNCSIFSTLVRESDHR